MNDVSVLEVHLYGQPVGTLTFVQGERTIFTFNQSYIDQTDRPTLSLSFKDSLGELITRIRPTTLVVPPFFSNLLPEGHLRKYLAEKAGVNEQREFFLLWILGEDLPGAVSVRAAEGMRLPPKLDAEIHEAGKRNALHFSLAGVQLKFSALKNEGKLAGLTIPTRGAGGSWIVKLPSTQFAGVPENEFSMMTLARQMGMNVPELQLVSLSEIGGLPEGLGDLRGDKALAVKRFDRSEDGPIHIEDFTQVFGLKPGEKYEKASYSAIAKILGIETGHADIKEYIRRLTFSTLIGNGDMHLKNWSLIYRDAKTPSLSPAYDLLSTLPYIPDDDAALKYATTKGMAKFSKSEITRLADRALLPASIIIDTAIETLEKFWEVWGNEKDKLPLSKDLTYRIEEHAKNIALNNR